MQLEWDMKRGTPKPIRCIEFPQYTKLTCLLHLIFWSHRTFRDEDL